MIRRLVLLLLISVPAYADISFIAQTYTHSGSVTSRTGTEPTGTAEDDLVIAAMAANDETSTFTDPTDFTEVDQLPGGVGGNWSGYVGYKVRGATAGDGYTFGYGASTGLGLQLVTIRGIDTSQPLDITYVRANHFVEAADAPNTACAAATTNTDGAWVVLLQSMSADISGAAGLPSGYTLLADNLTGGVSSRQWYVVRKLISPAGTETPGVFTHTDDDVNPDPDPHCFTLVIKPAVAETSATLLLRRRR